MKLASWYLGLVFCDILRNLYHGFLITKPHHHLGVNTNILELYPIIMAKQTQGKQHIYNFRMNWLSVGWRTKALPWKNQPPHHVLCTNPCKNDTMRTMFFANMSDMRCKFQYRNIWRHVYAIVFVSDIDPQISTSTFTSYNACISYQYYIYTICACISFDIPVYMFTCTKNMFSHKIYPGKTSPRTPFWQTAQVGTAPAAHGALQAMDPKRSWQCTWRCGKKKRLSWFFSLEKIEGNKYWLYIYIYPVNSLFLYLFIVFTLHCFFAMCSEPLAVSSDISGKCLFVFLEADASKQHLWHLGCFWQDDGCDFTHRYVFFVPNFFFVWIPSWSLP